MLFNSYIFILIFLPIAVIGYFALCRYRYSWAKKFLIAMSLWFYSYANPYYLIVIVFSIIVNYVLSRCMLKQNKYKKLILILLLCFNIGIIFVFKYLNFTLSIINGLFKAGIAIKYIEMPLGISFFTFQQISFVVDSYRGETKDYTFEEYALFIAFFPQLVAGPIVLHDEMIPQFRDVSLRKVNCENVLRGIILFTFGLFKKIFVADLLLPGVDWGYSNYSSLSSLECLLVMIGFTLQLYFDFSAYSDMATGIALMFNWKLPINFDSPFKSLSIGEFWRRWHITLNRFLTKYIYIPLGGSRKGKTRTYINVLIVFFISGLWHGADFTFIIWGMINGIGCVIYRMIARVYDKVPKAIRWLLTFIYASVAFGIFRADSVVTWIDMMKTMIMEKSFTVSSAFMQSFEIKELTFTLNNLGLENLLLTCPYIHMAVIMGLSLLGALILKNNYRRVFKLNALTCILTSIILVCCIFSLSGVTKFLYFNF